MPRSIKIKPTGIIFLESCGQDKDKKAFHVAISRSGYSNSPLNSSHKRMKKTIWKGLPVPLYFDSHEMPDEIPDAETERRHAEADGRHLEKTAPEGQVFRDGRVIGKDDNDEEPAEERQAQGGHVMAEDEKREDEVVSY